MADTAAVAYIGVGSNIRPEENVPRALELLGESPGITVTGISTFYRTAPLSDPEQVSPVPGEPTQAADPDFLNGVLEIRSRLSPPELLERFAEIEAALGRTRVGNRYAPRPMDLDLLLFGLDKDSGGSPEWKELSPEGVMAHRDIQKRGFVALPLLELAPDLLLPPHRIPLQALALSFGTPGGKAEETLSEELRRKFLSS